MTVQEFLVLGFTIIFSSTLPGPASALTVEEAENLCRDSGRPMLVVAGRHTCGNTTAVLECLKDRSVVPLVAQYISVYVNVDEAEGKAWRKKYGSPGNTLPYVYIIRADGEKLFSHSGIMDSRELRALLLAQAANVGRTLSAKETALLQKALDKAKRAHKNGDEGEAIKSLLVLKKLGPLGSINTYTGPAVEANRLVAKLAEDGKNTLRDVDAKFADSNATFAAALAYARAKRTFAALPTLKADLAAADRKYERQRSLAAAIHQAELLDRAEVTAASHNNAKKAAEAFQRIISAYPDTEVAKVAAEDLKELPDQGPAAAAAKSAYRIWSDTTGRFSVKARCCGVRDGKLSLETEDGRMLQVPLYKLSDRDRKFLESEHETP
jgi:hypothetical protein